jgi:hypothetical protein
MRTLPFLPMLLFPLLVAVPLLRTIGGLGPVPPAVESLDTKRSERDPAAPQPGLIAAPQGTDAASAAKEKPRAVRRGA